MEILIIEDHADLAANIGEFLAGHGAIVDFAADGHSGSHLALTNRYDAIVLDLGLPGIDGLELCRRLRTEAASAVPILILTARDTEREKLAGFAAGADDYLTKPFSLAELHARLTALVRRTRGHAGELRVSNLVLNTQTRVARRDGRRLLLRPAELRLLEILMRASPGLVERRDVARQMWGDNPPESDAALRGHIHALRAAIDVPGEPRLIHTVHSVGYRLGGDDAV